MECWGKFSHYHQVTCFPLRAKFTRLIHSRSASEELPEWLTSWRWNSSIYINSIISAQFQQWKPLSSMILRNSSRDLGNPKEMDDLLQWPQDKLVHEIKKTHISNCNSGQAQAFDPGDHWQVRTQQVKGHANKLQVPTPNRLSHSVRINIPWCQTEANSPWEGLKEWQWTLLFQIWPFRTKGSWIL